MKNSQFWLNLPVSDINRSRQFYLDIGFELNEQFDQSEEAVSLFIGVQKIVLMLFPVRTFGHFIQEGAEYITSGNEVLFSLSVESREDVDKIAKLVRSSGGDVFAPPSEEQGVIYGMSFSDPDGHKWNVIRIS
jgi:predicted lactoylglutathione lyase